MAPPAGSDEHVGPLTVVVRAPAGTLDAVGVGDPALIVAELGPGTRVAALPGRPDALQLAWIGGECDDRVEMVLEPIEGGLRIRAKTDQGFVTSCSAVGVPRAIELDLAAPIDPNLVVVVPGA